MTLVMYCTDGSGQVYSVITGTYPLNTINTYGITEPEPSECLWIAPVWSVCPW